MSTYNRSKFAGDVTAPCNGGMARKQTINFLVHPQLAAQFREMTKAYFGKLGLCFSAAMLQFLETDPRQQAEYIKRVFEAELNDEVDEVVQAARTEQARRIKSREKEHKEKR
jgi:hypothetical protein